MKTHIMLAMLFATTGLANPAHSEPVSSLRGAVDILQNSRAPTAKQYIKDREPFERDYVQQPPLIPHKIRNYRINLKSNKCMSCHSWAKYRKAGATKISQTHFEDRNKQVLANVSPRRHFCTQCHVPQVNIKPLVGNSFQPIKAITSQ